MCSKARPGCTSTSPDVPRAGRLVVATLLVALTACGGGDGSSGARSSGQRGEQQEARPELSTDDPGCEFIVAGTGTRSTTPGESVEYLVDAVAEPFECFDKVTFTFDPGDAPVEDTPPGYTVEYREPPFGLVGPDGEPVANSTEGCCAGEAADANAVLYVEMQPASTTDLRNPPLIRNCEGAQTYCGNLRLRLEGMEHVVIVEWITPDNLPPDPTPEDPSDNKVIWLIGLDERRPFTVDFARDPTPHVNVLIMR